tara:strand:+ start:3160 stop:3456 length:297 start_codon:yes stop_codon:yes gene_type:complete
MKLNIMKLNIIMCHPILSYNFKNYLYETLPFPELVIEIIIKYLNLAVDINLKNNELKLLIIKDKICYDNKYLKKKYNKTIHTAKRYQLINYIQRYNLL